MPHYREGFHLPPDYYKRVPTWITVMTVLVAWIMLPVLSYNPDLFDPFLNDYYQKIADGQKHNIIKVFNILLWLHAIECIIAAQKCRKMGINAHTTLHWILSVAVHGFPALRYLIWPDKDVTRVKTH